MEDVGDFVIKDRVSHAATVPVVVAVPVNERARKLSTAGAESHPLERVRRGSVDTPLPERARRGSVDPPLPERERRGSVETPLPERVRRGSIERPGRRHNLTVEELELEIGAVQVASPTASPDSPETPAGSNKDFKKKRGWASPIGALKRPFSSQAMLLKRPISLQLFYDDEKGVFNACPLRLKVCVLVTLVLLIVVIVLCVTLIPGDEPAANVAMCTYDPSSPMVGKSYCGLTSKSSSSSWKCSNNGCKLSVGVAGGAALSFPLLHVLAGLLDPFYHMCPSEVDKALSNGENLVSALVRLSTEEQLCPLAVGSVSMTSNVVQAGSPVRLSIVGSATAGASVRAATAEDAPDEKLVIFQRKPTRRSLGASDKWATYSLRNRDGSRVLSVVDPGSGKLHFAWEAPDAANVVGDSFELFGDKPQAQGARMRFMLRNGTEHDACLQPESSSSLFTLIPQRVRSDPAMGGSCFFFFPSLNSNIGDQLNPTIYPEISLPPGPEVTLAPTPSQQVPLPTPLPTEAPTEGISWPPPPLFDVCLAVQHDKCNLNDASHKTITDCVNDLGQQCSTVSECKQMCTYKNCNSVLIGYTSKGETRCTLFLPTVEIATPPLTTGSDLLEPVCMGNLRKAGDQACATDQCFQVQRNPCSKTETGATFIWGVEPDYCRLACLRDASCLGFSEAHAFNPGWRDVGCFFFTKLAANSFIGQCERKVCSSST